MIITQACFSGDDSYAEDTLNECSPRIEVSGWVRCWPLITPPEDDIWSNAGHQPW